MNKPFRAVLLFLLSFVLSSAIAQQVEYGEASYFDDSFQGRETAYGVKYDKNELTAAHKLYPFGTILKVTRLDNKKSVNVKVIDKGPYLKGRVVDLSRKAAEVLGMIGEGAVNVKVEVVKNAPNNPLIANNDKPKDNTAIENVPKSYDEPTTPPIQVSKPATKQNDKSASPTTTTASNKTDAAKSTKTTSTATQKTTAKLVGKDYKPYDLYQIQLMRPAKKGFGVQIASLTTYEYVLRQVADLQAKSFDNILISVEKGSDNNSVYKVILGNFDKQESADRYQKDLKKKYKINGFVVDLSATKYE